jgi:glycosyltransferase involved in cell wall biosynthesis
MQLSIVLPCYNEAENVEAAVADVRQWFSVDGIDGEIIAVDDGSSDGTGPLLDRLAQAEPLLRVVHHEVNRGYGSAVRTGCDAATKEWIAFMDSDGQFKAEDFRKLIEWTDRFDLVTGRKIKRADPLIRRLNAKFYALLVFVVLGVWVRDINCAMKMFRREVWSVIRPTVATGALFNGELFYRAKRNGIRWKQVFVNHYPRLRGTQTGANLSVILKMFRDLWRLKRDVRF